MDPSSHGDSVLSWTALGALLAGLLSGIGIKTAKKPLTRDEVTDIARVEVQTLRRDVDALEGRLHRSVERIEDRLDSLDERLAANINRLEETLALRLRSVVLSAMNSHPCRLSGGSSDEEIAS